MAHARHPELGYVWVAPDFTSSFVQWHFVERHSWQNTGTNNGLAYPHKVVLNLDGKTQLFNEFMLWHDPGCPGCRNIPPAPPRPEHPSHLWLWTGAKYDKIDFLQRRVQENSPLDTPHRILCTSGAAASVTRGSPGRTIIETLSWQNPISEQGDVEMRDAGSQRCQVASPSSPRTTADWTRWVHSAED